MFILDYFAKLEIVYFNDGSEAYSLAIMLDDIGENLDKYSILAVDRDSEVIKYANQRRINLEQGDFGALGKVLKNKREYFINEDDAIDIPDERSFMHLDTVMTRVDHDKFAVHSHVMSVSTIYEITDAGKNELNIKETTIREVLPYPFEFEK